MSSNPVDAVGSFAYIVDNVPRLRARVADLMVHAANKNAEFKADYAKTAHKVKARRIRSRSISSIHSDGLKLAPTPSPDAPSTVQSPLTPANINPMEAGDQYIYAQANKRRRTGTSVRSGASGPMKYRSRQTVIIHYDSYIQEQLDALVKEFGGCRNTLRKGKMAYTVSKGLQLPTLKRGTDTNGPPNPILIRSTYMTRSSPRLALNKDDVNANQPIPAGEAAFQRTDKELESCQNACETAAHQFLRDGDCYVELEDVVKSLDAVLDFAQSAHHLLKAEEEEERRTERSNSLSDSIHTTSGSTLVEKLSREQLHFPRKPGLTIDHDFALLPKERPHFTSTVSAPPLTTDIEVDDDESDAASIEIDITQFRTNRAPRMHV